MSVTSCAFAAKTAPGLCQSRVRGDRSTSPSCHARAPRAAWKSRSRRPCLSLRHCFTHRGVVRDALRARFRDDVHSRYAAVGEDHEDAYETSDCHGCGGCVDDAPRGLLLPTWLWRLRRTWLRGRTCLCARLRSGLCARLWLFIGHHRGWRRLRELRLWRRLEPAATAEIWRAGLWRSWLWWPGSSAPSRLWSSAAGWPALWRPSAGLWASAATARWICRAGRPAWSPVGSAAGRATAIRAGCRPG
jgi:hypothetical protein